MLRNIFRFRKKFAAKALQQRELARAATNNPAANRPQMFDLFNWCLPAFDANSYLHAAAR
jgi:hypothetical protein